MTPPWAAADRSVPLKRYADVRLGKMLQSEPRNPADVELRYLRAANVQPDGVMALSDAKTMWFGSSEVEQLAVRGGDVVVVEGGVGGFGRAAFIGQDLEGWGFQNSINRVRPYDGVDGRYLTYALIAARATGWIRAYCNIVSMPHLTADKLRELRVPACSASDQRRFADYLDRETSRIDELIVEQEVLLRDLAERRRAIVEGVIAQQPAVSAGQRFKHVIARVRQGWSPQCDSVAVDGRTEWAVLRTGCVNRGVFNPSDNKRLPDDVPPRASAIVRRGEVVMSRASTRDLVGSAAVVRGDYPRLMLSDKLYSIEVDAHVAEAEYVALVLGTRRVRDQIELEASGASHSMVNISQADIVNLPMELPGVRQQRTALRACEATTAVIDELVQECGAAVSLLRERRAALITAAVTGQLDAREEVDTPGG